MNLYLGVTDRHWFEFLKARQPDEVNFWKPSATSFRALNPGDLFLFKIRGAGGVVGGGGFFVRYQQLPLTLAWDVFGEKNGCGSVSDLRHQINKHRKNEQRDPTIGCTVLTAPFFFAPEDWIDVSHTWSNNIVQGKGYSTEEAAGASLWEKVQERLSRQAYANRVEDEPLTWLPEETRERYGRELLVRPRLGQGGFRLVVTDAYERRCSISGERTLPVLEAAHVRPYADDGPHSPDNGLLLRSDMHILFDRGYLTVTANLEIEVSEKIREEFENGRDYYQFHGQKLHHLPKQDHEKPAPQFLEWHNHNVYRG